MTDLKLAAALVCVLYGGWECIRRKQPLFLKSFLCAMVSYLLGTLFAADYVLVYGYEPGGFHAGILGYTRIHFLLLSSYYGVMNQLADDGGVRYRGYRLVAASGPLLALVLSIHSVRTLEDGVCLTYALLCLPIALTLYFSTKHLILPDVDLGIIRVMRSCNVCAIIFCMVQILLQAPTCSGLDVRTAGPVLSSVLLMTLLSMAEMGVRKWSI